MTDMQTTNILADLGGMTSAELLDLIDGRALPRALQIAPAGFNRLGRATATNARAEGFAKADVIATIGSAAS
jgi:hypothetical protein